MGDSTWFISISLNIDSAFNFKINLTTGAINPVANHNSTP